MKRLNKKMHYWLKFFIKLLPFIWLVVLFFGAIGSNVGAGNQDYSFLNELVNYFDNELYHDINTKIFDAYNNNTVFYYIIEMCDTFFIDFNDYVYSNIITSTTAYTILYLFEYWILVDFLDLIMHAFRFIIDFAHDLIDSFSDKSKGGFN